MNKTTFGIAFIAILMLLAGMVRTARAESPLDFALVDKDQTSATAG